MSRPFPRIPRIALSLLLMAPLVWFAGCTTPPARPQAEPLPDNMKVVSVAPLFAQAIRSIHDRTSVSMLFPDTRAVD